MGFDSIVYERRPGGIVIDGTKRKLQEAFREMRKRPRLLSSYLLKAQEKSANGFLWNCATSWARH